MQDIAPRVEFRAFAQCFGQVVERIRDHAACDRIRESAELYIVSADNEENNTKVRAGLMDIKALLGRERGLEQWRPLMKGEFPLSSEVIRTGVFAAFGVAAPLLGRPEYTLHEFIDDVVRPHAGLRVAQVCKRRYGFAFEGCLVEHAELLVNGAAIQTAAVESEDPEAVLNVMHMLGLHAYENVNYLLAVKRIVGMAPPPRTWCSE
jgi:hypothetical protein